MGRIKRGPVNIRKQMLKRWPEMTSSEREISGDSGDGKEADRQSAGRGATFQRGNPFQEPGGPLRNWQEANDLAVVREERV